MGSRLRRIGGEAAKFSAVNVVATFVAVLLFNALVHGLPGIYRPGPLHGYPVADVLRRELRRHADQLLRQPALRVQAPAGHGTGWRRR